MDARIGIGPPDGKWVLEGAGPEPRRQGLLPGRLRCALPGLAVPGFNNQIDSFVGDPHTSGARPSPREVPGGVTLGDDGGRFGARAARGRVRVTIE